MISSDPDSPSDPDDKRPVGRHTPAQGVLPTFDGETILWCTICADQRGDWCAQAEVMNVLHDLWQNHATGWLVGDYLIMPDHVHFFCAPSPRFFEVERWTAYWKDLFANVAASPGGVGNAVCFIIACAASATIWTKSPTCAKTPSAKSLCMIPNSGPGKAASM